MAELDLTIRNLLAEGWRKAKGKRSDYYIFLEKDTVRLKVSLNSGKEVSRENIEPKAVTKSSA
ncbi:MAG: hypothetical protein ACOYMZ_00180 [Minisyncoccia bacterium]